MIACPDCNTFNPDGEQVCLSCEAALRPAQEAGAERRTGVATPGGSGLGADRCPAGHPVDPSWSSCPYCTNGGRADRETRLEGSAPPPSAPPDPRATRLEGEPPAGASTSSPDPVPAGPGAAAGTDGGRPRPTRLEEPPQEAPPARHTVLRPASAPAGEAPVEPPPPQPSSSPGASGSAQSPRADTRPLVGVLAAPDAGSGGRVFPLRVGKNRIGGERGCEIRLEDDPQVSGQHALILHRGGTLYLTDRMSTNGTFLNGDEVDPAANAVVLGDRDRIRCGGTELIVLRLDPPPAPGGAARGGASGRS